MKISYFVSALVTVIVLFAGCGQGTESSNNQTPADLNPQPQQEIQKPLSGEEIKQFKSSIENTKNVYAANGSEENKKAYIRAVSDYAFALINGQGNFDEGLETYKELYKVDEPNSEARKKLVRYVLTLNLDQINAKNIQEAERMANALYQIRPDDFYVQSRMIMVFQLKADKAYEEGKYEEALNHIMRTTTFRFDAPALDKRMKLEIEIANKYLDQNKITKAEDLVRNITYTASLEGNESLKTKYGSQIDDLVKRYEELRK